MWTDLCLLLFLFSGFQYVQPKHADHADRDTHWDYLIFTQHWPPTVCKDWVQKNPSHSCSLPRKQDTWTIHGIWPTKIGTMGPEFCNKTWLFDPEEVRPIEAPLEQSWINIEAGTALYDLWAHEWNKHGTCAAAIEPLNSQIKYFTKGLDLLQNYTMSKILEENNVTPSDTKEYTIHDFYNTIKIKLGVEPEIECRYENGKQYLFELRICFSKALQLQDCDTHLLRSVTNCNPGRGIIYPESAGPANRILVQLYRLVTFLQWFTL